MNLEWNVFYYDFNTKEIKVSNVFNHDRYKADVEDLLHSCTDMNDFSDKLKSITAYYFWAKCGWEVKMFTVDDLKTGYRVVLHDGRMGIYVLENEAKPYIYGEHVRLTSNIRLYDGDDSESLQSQFMIEQVYKASSICEYWELRDEDLLWEYSDEVKDMTLKEIEDALGYKVRLIG